jgi:hypothetical protein
VHRLEPLDLHRLLPAHLAGAAVQADRQQVVVVLRRQKDAVAHDDRRGVALGQGRLPDKRAVVQTRRQCLVVVRRAAVVVAKVADRLAAGPLRRANTDQRKGRQQQYQGVRTFHLGLAASQVTG